MKYYILVKKKGAKSWYGAIPAKRGISKDKLKKVVRKQLKKGFVYKIVSEKVLRRYLTRMARQRKTRRPTYHHKRVRHHKVRHHKVRHHRRRIRSHRRRR